MEPKQFPSDVFVGPGAFDAGLGSSIPRVSRTRRRRPQARLLALHEALSGQDSTELMSLRVKVLASSDLDPSLALDLALDALEDLPHPCPKPFWRVLRALMSDILRLAPLSKDDLSTIIERCYETSLAYNYTFLDSYNFSLAALLPQEPRLRLARELENKVRGRWCLLDRQRGQELVDLIRAPILAAQTARVNSLRARRPLRARRGHMSHSGESL